MEISVVNWNIGGAKVLESGTKVERDNVREQINDELYALLQTGNLPEVVTLQEVAAYKQPSDSAVVSILDDRRLAKLGYRCFYFPLINSLGFSSQAKWRKLQESKTPEGDRLWEDNTFYSQGNAMLFRNDVPLFPFWDLSKPGEPSHGKRLQKILKTQKQNPMEQLKRAEEEGYKDYLIEHVHLTESVYGGDRDTEPRAALVAHIIMASPFKGDPKPIDIFVVNVHLVTLTKERVGIPAIDERASRLRLLQLEQIFNGIISPYNSWYADRFPWRDESVKPEAWETFDRHQPVWILCGDFNFTENSYEYDYVMHHNFLDTTPADNRHGIILSPEGKVTHKGTKAKGAGNPATLTVDYVFAGPNYVAFDPLIKQAGLQHNRVDHGKSASDHFPVISKIPLLIPNT